MRRLLTFLKQVFSAPNSHSLPFTAAEMTLHEALWICAGRVKNDDRPAVAQTNWRQIEVCQYCSESDLRKQWCRLNHALRRTANLTVILVLGDFLQGNLRELIRQPQLAHRLVIVPQPGQRPGIDHLGDLSLSAGSLGWNSIELCKDMQESTTATAPGRGEQLILVLPPSTSVRDVM